MDSIVDDAGRAGSAGRTAAGSCRRFMCLVCGYVYDEERGDPSSNVAPGTRWEDLPDGWLCPECGAPKSEFDEIDAD